MANYSDFLNRIDPVTVGVPEIRLNPEQDFRSGTNATRRSKRDKKGFQLCDDLSWVKGKHIITVGGDYEHTSIDGEFVFANPSRLRIFSTDADGNPLPFNTEDDFLNASVQDISLGIGDPNLPFNNGGPTKNNRFQIYGGDAWKITPRLTINYGVAYRWDSNLWNTDLSRPAVIAPLFDNGTSAPKRDDNNVAPRVGFAWDPFGDSKTVIRGGFGVYYDNTIDNLRLFERADLGPVGSEQLLVGTSIVSPVLDPFGGDGRFDRGQITLRQALALAPAVRADLESRLTDCKLPTALELPAAFLDRSFRASSSSPYSLQYSIGVQRELPGNLLLQVD